VWATAMPYDCRKQLVLNIYHEHHADFARFQGVADSDPISEKQRLQLAMKEATTILGLQNSHNTHTRIPYSRLEQHKGRLAELWPTLWELLGQPRKAINRKDQQGGQLGGQGASSSRRWTKGSPCSAGRTALMSRIACSIANCSAGFCKTIRRSTD